MRYTFLVLVGPIRDDVLKQFQREQPALFKALGAPQRLYEYDGHVFYVLEGIAAVGFEIPKHTWSRKTPPRNRLFSFTP
jgi:hypothetical protein